MEGSQGAWSMIPALYAVTDLQVAFEAWNLPCTSHGHQLRIQTSPPAGGFKPDSCRCSTFQGFPFGSQRRSNPRRARVVAFGAEMW
jgi:hypothetical protein